jgi:hypothetical protein
LLILLGTRKILSGQKEKYSKRKHGRKRNSFWNILFRPLPEILSAKAF